MFVKSRHFNGKTNLYFCLQENYREPDLIAHENLQVNNMLKNQSLAKGIQDAGWNLFFNILASKSEEVGRRVVKVSPAYTSQIFSGCGQLVNKTLAERTHKCPEYGFLNPLALAMGRTSTMSVWFIQFTGKFRGLF